MHKLRLISLLLFSCTLLTACDTYPYKKKIQSGYDRHNHSGNKAICMIVGNVPLSSYPFTTYHVEGEDLPFSSDTLVPYYNRLKNENLHYFSGLGFFTEEYVGEDLGKPIYRYDLTDLGRQYMDGFLGGTNFCFGRVVVDSVDRVRDGTNGIGGGKLRDVDITYHVENIPDWVKNSDAYIRYRYPKEMITGEQLEGEHTYRVLGKNKFETIVKVNRGFQEATRSDEIDQ